MVRYGIVCTGYFGAELGRSLLRLDNAKVTVVYDPENAEEIAKELGSKVASSLDELVSSSEVDCVIVASTNYLHREPVVKAALNGKHVFCEKPIALSYEDCKAMVDACKENNVIFMAGHIMNFFNGVHHARELVNNGTIGEVLYCKAARTGWEEMQPSVSWKKIREKSGGHLYHHIHELDCIQLIMGGLPEKVTMIGGNLAHKGDGFGDEEDLIVANLEYSDKSCAVLEWGTAFRWGEHYVLIEGTKGAIKLDLYHCGGTLKVKGQEDTTFLIHESKEEDDDRTRIYTGRGMDGAIAYGKPGSRTPLWLTSVIDKEMRYLHDIMQGGEIGEEYKKLLTGEAALEAVATADALMKSLNEDRKVHLSEIVK